MPVDLQRQERLGCFDRKTKSPDPAKAKPVAKKGADKEKTVKSVDELKFENDKVTRRLKGIWGLIRFPSKLNVQSISTKPGAPSNSIRYASTISSPPIASAAALVNMPGRLMHHSNLISINGL